jgi:3-isopropylmalate/(R)-2-methylmalate dehydratase large subunit
MPGQTMLDKVWARHVVTAGPGDRSLLYVDRHLVHEGSFHAFAMLERAGRRVRRPDLTVAVADHYVPTGAPAGLADPEIRAKVDQLGRNAAAWGVPLLGPGDPRLGIVHVIGPELGLTLPGLTVVCGDSHTATHGALGALAFGIGASEVEHVLATQTIWQRRPAVMRVRIAGRLGFGVAAKDLALHLIGAIGTSGGTGHVIEYAGPAVSALSMEARMTLCNMAIEAGSRAGMVAPDETTYAYLKGRPYAPKGAAWDRAVAYWKTLPSDPDAVFDAEVALDATRLVPMVTWGNSPEDALPVTGAVPDPRSEPDAERRSYLQRTLEYMGLTPGMALTDIAVDQVFIGSCTNARLEDLRAAAQVAKRGKAKVPVLVSPGSTQVKLAAEKEGLDRIFREAGFEWRESGCSMCVGMNGDLVAAGKRCASTSNRNFVGRQGKGSRTHLVSPAMAAAAALTGRITDVRKL